MTTMLETRDIILSYLYDNWTATDISWPNKTYNPGVNTSFIKIFFTGGRSVDLEIGIKGADLNSFTTFIDVFVPINTGNRQSLTYADELRTLFINFDHNDIQLKAPAIIELGENSGFYQTRVSIPTRILFYPI